MPALPSIVFQVHWADVVILVSNTDSLKSIYPAFIRLKSSGIFAGLKRTEDPLTLELRAFKFIKSRQQIPTPDVATLGSSLEVLESSERASPNFLSYGILRSSGIYELVKSPTSYKNSLWDGCIADDML